MGNFSEDAIKKGEPKSMSKNNELKVNRYYVDMLNKKPFCMFPYWLATRFSLTMTDVGIFSIIHQYTNHVNRSCYQGSVERLCTYVNGSKPTVRKSLQTLNDLGFIRKEIKAVKDNKTGFFKNWVTYTSVISFNRADNMSVEEQLDAELERRKTIMPVTALSKKMKIN